MKVIAGCRYALLTFFVTYPLLSGAEEHGKLRSVDADHVSQCAVPLVGYGPEEKKVWDSLCVGKRYEAEEESNETLAAEFIVDVLTNKKYREALPFQGVNISGVNVSGRLDLKDAVLSVPLRIEKSKFENPPDFTSFKSSRDMSLNGSTFICPDKVPEKEKEKKVVKMAEIQVDGAISLQSTTFGKCNLDLSHAKVTGTLFLNGDDKKRSQFAKITASNAYIGEKVSLELADVNDELDMAYSDIATNMKMARNSNFNKVTFTGIKIGGDLELSDHDRRGSTLAELNLNGAHVGGQFSLSDIHSWTGKRSIMLNQTVVGAVNSGAAPPHAWPSPIEMTGFSYSHAGEFWGNSAETKKTMVENFKAWLALQPSREPYEQLGEVLKKEGYPDQANDILLTGREIELMHTPDWSFTKIWLIFQDAFIGFGYCTWRSIGWSALFIAVGALVFRRTEEARIARYRFGIAYSVDMLLPVIRLREKHYQVDLLGWQRYYFYFHKIMGFILASFIAASLSGLTK